jgi:hypothetical protein
VTTQSPKHLKWVEDCLALLAPAATPDLVFKHAGAIFCAVMDIRASRPSKLVDGKRVRVKGRRKGIGTKDELLALRAAANKAVASPKSLDQRNFWKATWVDTSEETRRSLEWDACGDVAAWEILEWVAPHEGGGDHILPYPQHVLPLIEAALGSLAATPGAERKKRYVAPRKLALDKVMATAVMGLLGPPALDRQPRGRLLTLTTLALRVDERFKLDIYTHSKCAPIRDLRALYLDRASLQTRT